MSAAAAIQRQRQKPRTLPQHRGGLIEQPFRLGGITHRQGHFGQPVERVAHAPGNAERAEPLSAAGESVARYADVADGMFDVPEQMAGHHADVRVDDLQFQRASDGCTREIVFTLREPQNRSSHERP